MCVQHLLSRIVYVHVYTWATFYWWSIIYRRRKHGFILFHVKCWSCVVRSYSSSSSSSHAALVFIGCCGCASQWGRQHQALSNTWPPCFPVKRVNPREVACSGVLDDVPPSCRPNSDNYDYQRKSPSPHSGSVPQSLQLSNLDGTAAQLKRFLYQNSGLRNRIETLPPWLWQLVA